MKEHEKEFEDVDQEEEMEETNGDSCGCCCKSDESEDISVKEVAYHADDKIDALIQLLIKKNLFTEHEFEEEYNALFENNGEEDELK